MKIRETAISGCFELQGDVHLDRRGSFQKTMQASVFRNFGLDTEYCESFHTTSVANVLRGMHLQIGQFDGTKIVSCAAGRILDVVLDLRRESTSLGHCQAFELTAGTGTSIYIPKGIAHGFYVLSESAITSYQTSREYSESHDTGVRWDTFGFEWPCRDPIISSRDAGLPSLDHFLGKLLHQDN